MTAVTDPFGVTRDPALHFLPEALDPARAEHALHRAGVVGHVTHVTVTRHKVGRRCLITYHLDTPGGQRVVLGKVRARGADHRTHHLMSALRERGLNEVALHGIAVPEPLGMIEPWHMTLQAWVPGVNARDVFTVGDTGTRRILARRAAQAAHRLHRAGVPATRTHSVQDELGILEARLTEVAAGHPLWRVRLERLMRGCRALALALPGAQRRGVHRDFYPDQLLLSGERLYLLDFDLYSLGNPELDPGNFNAHLIELALREHGDSHALQDAQDELTREFLTLESGASTSALDAYTTLSLARHIAISQRIPERRHLTATILEVCEARFAVTTPREEVR